MSEWGKEVALAQHAARAAGGLLREAFDEDKAVLSTEGRDIKLEADQAAEAKILETLEGTPFDVLAEESGEHGNPNRGEPVWIVDPLDGTMNFSRGIPLCCVSIGLSRPDEPLAGVVYDFLHDDMYSGAVGMGARLNGQPIAVSEIAEAQQAVLATGFPTRFEFEEGAFRELLTQYARFKKVRLLGSAAMSLAYVASGRVEAYAEDGIMYWDVAAGLALVKAAGGAVDIHPAEDAGHPWARTIRAAAHSGLWG